MQIRIGIFCIKIIKKIAIMLFFLSRRRKIQIFLFLIAEHAGCLPELLFEYPAEVTFIRETA